MKWGSQKGKYQIRGAKAEEREFLFVKKGGGAI